MSRSQTVTFLCFPAVQRIQTSDHRNGGGVRSRPISFFSSGKAWQFPQTLMASFNWEMACGEVVASTEASAKFGPGLGAIRDVFLSFRVPLKLVLKALSLPQDRTWRTPGGGYRAPPKSRGRTSIAALRHCASAPAVGPRCGEGLRRERRRRPHCPTSGAQPSLGGFRAAAPGFLLGSNPNKYQQSPLLGVRAVNSFKLEPGLVVAAEIKKCPSTVVAWHGSSPAQWPVPLLKILRERVRDRCRGACAIPRFQIRFRRGAIKLDDPPKISYSPSGPRFILARIIPHPVSATDILGFELDRILHHLISFSEARTPSPASGRDSAKMLVHSGSHSQPPAGIAAPLP